MRRLLLVLTLSGLLTGCPKSPPPPAPADAAAADASPTATKAPYALSFVARDASHGRFSLITDDALLFEAGFFVYEVGPDGVLRRLGSAADYAPLVDELPDDMLGYDAEPKYGRPHVQRVDGKTVLTTYQEKPSSLQWDGRAWKTVPFIPARFETHGEETPLPDAGVTAPEGSWSNAHRIRDGRYAWSRSREGVAEVYVARPDGGPGKITNPVKQHPKGGPVNYINCSFPPAMDGRLYIECSMAATADGEWSSHVYRLDGDDHWVHVDIPERSRHGAMAIDTEGGMWFSVGTDGNVIARRTTDGTIARLDFPKIDSATAKPSFHLDTIATTKSKSFDDGLARDYRHWTAGRVVATEPDCKPSHVSWLVPRPTGEVWISLSCGNGALVLRASRSAYEAPALAIGTRHDDLNELRNTKPPRAWVGHCNQLFVAVTRSSGDAGAPAVDRLLGERAAVENLAKKFSSGDSYTSQVKLVTGRYVDKNVAGVLLVRSYPEAKEAAMEKAARDIVEHFTANPASPPEVFCTLPVLDKLL